MTHIGRTKREVFAAECVAVAKVPPHRQVQQDQRGIDEVVGMEEPRRGAQLLLKHCEVRGGARGNNRKRSEY